MSVVERLECGGSGQSTRLKFEAPGRLDRQTLRGVRELTAQSALALDEVIQEHEAQQARGKGSALDAEVPLAAGAWLFQYRQQDYEVEDFVATHGEYDWWEVLAHRSEMCVGDRVYFRRTRGEKPSGITAVGRLVSPVYPTGVPERPYRIDVHYEQRIFPPLTTEDAAGDDILSQKPALARGIQGTNFDLSAAEVQRIEELIRGNHHEFNLHELTFDPAIPLDERTRTLATVVQRQGQPEFRNRLIVVYDGRCAVTGCDAVEALEAAHIRPYLGPHTNVVTNGLLLRADIHTLFDKGLLAIDADRMTLVLHPTLMTTVYRGFAGKTVRLPAHAPYRPNPESLRQHRKKSGL
jgi:hypothetical protein